MPYTRNTDTVRSKAKHRNTTRNKDTFRDKPGTVIPGGLWPLLIMSILILITSYAR